MRDIRHQTLCQLQRIGAVIVHHDATMPQHTANFSEGIKVNRHIQPTVWHQVAQWTANLHRQ